MKIITNKIKAYILISAIILIITTMINYGKENPQSKYIRIAGIIGSTLWVVGIQQLSDRVCTGIIILFLGIWGLTSIAAIKKVAGRDSYDPNHNKK